MSMFTFQNTAKKSLAGLFVAVLFFAAFAPFASAQTYYYPVAYSQNTAQFQALVNQINALLAQLQLMQTQNLNANYHKYYFNNGTPKNKVVNYGNYYNNNYEVEVSTEDFDVENNDTVTLFGDIDLDGAPFADVWFEYGTDGDLDDDSDDIRVTQDGEFDIEVDNIDDNDKYYFRAIAEDPSGNRSYGTIKSFDIDGNNNDNNNNDGDIPDVTTEDAEDVDDNSAELHGEVDMNDFEDGTAFFVYGEDENAIEDVEDEDMYSDVDEDGDDLQKVLLSSNVDDTRTFWASVYGLNDNTEHFFRICVEYEDEDGDDTLECGDVESFETD